MVTIATLGPEKSPTWLAAKKYDENAEIRLYSNTRNVIKSFLKEETDYAILPVYNTREGENKQYFSIFDQLDQGYWVDNVILSPDLACGSFHSDDTLETLSLVIGSREAFSQCADFIERELPTINQMMVNNIDQVIEQYRQKDNKGIGIIHNVDTLVQHGLFLLEREVAPYNRTRFAVFARELSQPTGYDATTIVTVPLDDRVGLLFDILGEFSKQGINLIDMRSENDLKTQKLQIYLETEGHINTVAVHKAIEDIESKVIKQKGAVRILGSFPRIDIRTKHIKSFGFIGTGDMSQWFAERLENEGYDILLSGRTTPLRPEEMISSVDVVVICVPISVTEQTIRKYGPMIGANKALIILAGESEETVNAGLEATGEHVEVMLVHNLWGPQAATMKDKNAIVVRTPRSGLLCSEFEAFLYKHGALIYHDSPVKHDLLMGVGQKLPTAISVALAMTLQKNGITSEEIASHCTLTSLYPIIAMARVHSQNPRTYAEIMSASGEGGKIVDDFLDNLQKVKRLAEQSSIQELSEQIEDNIKHFSSRFLQARMDQSKAVDEVLGKMT